jgi:hypothetical protein
MSSHETYLEYPNFINPVIKSSMSYTLEYQNAIYERPHDKKCKYLMLKIEIFCSAINIGGTYSNDFLDWRSSCFEFSLFQNPLSETKTKILYKRTMNPTFSLSHHYLKN